MALYNLNPIQPSKSYKQAATANPSYATQDKTVINPTYTKIDWETRMENPRIQTIQEFMKMTEELITESKCKQTKNHTKLATTAIKYLIAHVRKLQQKDTRSF